MLTFLIKDKIERDRLDRGWGRIINIGREREREMVEGENSV
jgi:hypothetical protein